MAVRKPDLDAPGSRSEDMPQSQGEVRAGPGDAGRQDRPERLPPQPGERRRGRQATILLFGLIAVGAIVWALTVLAT